VTDLATFDEQTVVVDFLEAQAVLSGVSIYAGEDEPPAGYKPANGAAIVFRTRGGEDDDVRAVMTASIQCKCYGATPALAMGTAHKLHAALVDAKSSKILAAERETMPMPLREPETDWPYALVFYSVMVIDQ